MNNSRYFSSTPPVVLNLIIINALMLLATELLPVGNRIVGALALFNVESPLFHSYQLVTYMFLHGGFSHLFFNMFALWMFGRTLEYELGSKRFLTTTWCAASVPGCCNCWSAGWNTAMAMSV